MISYITVTYPVDTGNICISFLYYRITCISVYIYHIPTSIHIYGIYRNISIAFGITGVFTPIPFVLGLASWPLPRTGNTAVLLAWLSPGEWVGTLCSLATSR